MLEQVDLKKKLGKKEFKEEMGKLLDKMQEVGARMYQEKIPLVIVFEGWHEAGKDSAIEKLVERLDPRNFKVHRIQEPIPEEKFHPFLWRFWTKTPARGRIAIFYNSWYGRVLVERIEKLAPKKEWQEAYNEIRNFERQLADDGNVIVKFFMHISEKEQATRYKKCLNNKYLAYRIDERALRQHKKYKKYYRAVEEMLEKTSTHYAPWTIVEATDEKWAKVKIFKTVIEACLQGIENKRRKEATAAVNPTIDTEQITRHVGPTILDKVDLSLKLEDNEYEKLLQKYQVKLRELEFEIYKKRIPVVIGYEGWDAAGKGGNIKRLTTKLDPRGYEVIPIAAPNTEEKEHHFLWRFWRQLPKAGHISIFDRTWYGRVLVERIEGFCTEEEWRRAYQEINEFEEHLASYGTVICKFWLHISKEEQLRRFEERKTVSYKNYKITEEDWRNREKWDQYEEAVLDMLERTSTTYAPWTIVEGKDKNWARIKTLRTVCEAIEKRLKKK